jgi:flagellar export protein FliJ
MKGFTFRLEKVWSHRKRMVDEHSVAVARGEKRVADLARSMALLDQDIARQEMTLAAVEGETLGIRELRDATTWLNHLRRRRENMDFEIQAAVRELDRWRSALTEAWRELEVLSRLREQQEAQWAENQKRTERRDMDEIGQIRAFRHGQAKGSH